MASYKLPMSTISPTDKRNDLHLTSTGIGHTYRQEPAAKTRQSYLLEPLPAKYSHPHPLFAATSIESTYSPTTATEHCYKPIDYNEQKESIYKRSPTLHKINYLLHVKDKLNEKSWRRPLTMSHQRSEMKDNYQGKKDDIIGQTDQSDPIETILADHHSNGPTKIINPTDTNRQLQGQPFNAIDQAILHVHQPYLTTNHCYHRRFGKRELQSYPKKDIATYWSTEGYPQAWGHGPAINLLPKLPHSERTDRQETSRLTISQTRRQPILVSNALKTQYSSQFTDHSKRNPFQTLAPPTFASTVIDTDLLDTVPNMYKTSNQIYGQRDPLHI